MAQGVSNSNRPAKPPIWNDPVYRALFFQFLVLGGVIALGAYLISNTLDNLARQGIASGFGFLDTTAGFSILMSLIDYSEENTYGRAFFVGLFNTLLVAGIGIFFATIFGFLVGVARLSSNWLLAKMATVYIETLRNIPLLLQIFFWYFGVLRNLPAPRDSAMVMESFFLNNRGLYSPRPVFEDGFALISWAFVAAIVIIIFMAKWAHKRQEKTGQQFHTVYASIGIIIGLPSIAAVIAGFPMSWNYPELTGFNFTGGIVVIPELVSLALALSLYTATFIAEIVRSGIMAVSHGQTEASYALGIKPGVTLRKVVIPQALRVIIPPLTSQYLNLTKNSSLAAAIAYPDLVLVFGGIVLNQTGQAIEVLSITMAVYLTISLLISAFMNWYNNKMALVER